MIRALNYPDRAKFTAERVRGSFWVGPANDEKTRQFWYVCPCGCGVQGMLLVGDGFKPEADRPSWNWNGSLTEPTLGPSVNHVDHWHGWLRDGYWQVC